MTPSLRSCVERAIFLGIAGKPRMRNKTIVRHHIHCSELMACVVFFGLIYKLSESLAQPPPKETREVVVPIVLEEEEEPRCQPIVAKEEVTDVIDLP